MMTIDDRQNQLLKAIIELYIQTAEPVASLQLQNSLDFELSAATIRNEMMELERLGYLAQPHISAGRVPTVKGLQYYIASLMEEREMERRQARQLSRARLEGLRELTREVAEVAQATTFIAASEDEYYIAGLGKLLSQPEFISNSQLVLEATEVMDQLDVLLPQLFGRFAEEPTVLFGRDNPFGVYCSAVIASRHKDGETVIGVIAPMRSNYALTISALEEAMRLL
jgi:transcriptional regulator of heat shock response